MSYVIKNGDDEYLSDNPDSGGFVGDAPGVYWTKAQGEAYRFEDRANAYAYAGFLTVATYHNVRVVGIKE